MSSECADQQIKELFFQIYLWPRIFCKCFNKNKNWIKNICLINDRWNWVKDEHFVARIEE